MAIERSRGHSLPEEVITELLAHPYRRALLRALARDERPRTVRELARAIVSTLEPHTQSSESPAPPDSERVRRELYDRHLPKLTATTVVVYNPQQATVEPGRAFALVADRL
ncbi:DUF7344 domain-containing protein [Halocatena halophila]|uniref:DUF7344 domain-containing protein n=1 Tax=Halocatena halophila TaxID=2814576 RepID=UPI002ED30630